MVSHPHNCDNLTNKETRSSSCPTAVITTVIKRIFIHERILTASCLCSLSPPPHRALSHTPASLPINQTQHCKMLPGMVSSQAQLCRSNLELMQTIIQAAREVKKTCQKTFADMRWNCSSIDIPVDASKYRPDLDRGISLGHHEYIIWIIWKHKLNGC